MPRRPSRVTLKKSARQTHKVAVQIDEDYAGDVPARFLRETARAALAHQHAGPGALTVVLTGDERLRDLNRSYLGHDYATDVLSFPSESDDPDADGRYYGDIAVSYPRALEQARAGGHGVDAELQLLTVHGVLHLLGHDHATAAQKKRMWAAQAEILSSLDCPISGPANE